jgi:phosphate transport system substrate-binding protein
MSRKFQFVILPLVIISFLLSACASPAATPQTVEVIKTVQVEVTKIVAGTPVVQQVMITATSEAKPTELPKGSVTLNGAGATFPLPIYTDWNYAYQYVDPSVVLNYQGIGSGGGKKAIIDNTVDYAGSDSLLKDEEYTAGKDLQMYPMLAGAVVPIYNLEGLAAGDPALILDGATVAGIYSGKIKNWNDPAIVALNPGLAAKLPNKPITAVHRSDGSGTTEIFTKYLASSNQDWKDSVGASSAVEWPVDKSGNGIGGKGNAGVAAAVQNTPDSVGYVELNYAVANNILFAQLVNQAGKTVTANADSLASAMSDFAGSFSDKLTADIENGTGAGSWPISGYTYLVLHTTSMQDCTKAQKLLEFIKWALNDPAAAERAGKLGYSVLTADVRDKVMSKLGELTCNGQKVMQ